MNKQTRIVSNIFGEDQYLNFQIQKENGEWVTVGSTGVVTTKSIWTKALRLVDGNMTEQVRRMCSEYQMEDAVLLPGRQTDVVAWYSAMDLFLLPSKFEGLGIVYLEAQANGLHCFGSDCVPEETQVTNRMHRISLKHNASRWADEITAILDANHTSRAADDIELFQKANYDSRFVAGRLYEIYESFHGNKAE